MTELDMLRGLLLVSLALVPFATERAFIAPPWRHRTALHLGSLAAAAASLFSPLPQLSVGWLFYCGAISARLGLQLLRQGRWRSLSQLAKGVPCAFSVIGAVWLVGATNDLRILGYGPTFSFYAALHGNVLGVLVVGSLAALANDVRPHRRLYLAAVLVCFASFLLIALGIDQLRAIKPIGVVGLSAAIPISQLAFLKETRSRHRRAFALALVSLVGLAFTMLLAWRNELLLPPLVSALGIRGMVSVHGVLNALVVAPAWLLAVTLDRRRSETPPCREHGRT